MQHIFKKVFIRCHSGVVIATAGYWLTPDAIKNDPVVSEAYLSVLTR
jgi:hypothetical protein